MKKSYKDSKSPVKSKNANAGSALLPKAQTTLPVKKYSAVIGMKKK